MDVVTRAVKILLPEKASAYIECTTCASPALRLNAASLRLGSSKGLWSRNHNVGAFFLRGNKPTDTLLGGNKLIDTETFALIVSEGAVVLSAQHIISAGVEHDMNALGFKKGLRALTHHECSVCARECGTSIRLRVDACAKIAAQVDFMDSVIREVALDNVKVRLQCSTCVQQLDEGRTLLAPARQDKHKNPLARTFMTAMGGISVPHDVNDTHRCGQLLYFSRNTGKPAEAGILIWVVDQALPVVHVADMTSVFEPGSTAYEFKSQNASYEFKPLNAHCHAHTSVYPRPCVICARQIKSVQQAVVADGLRGPVHVACSQRCTTCETTVARLGPTPDEATEREQCIALPALRALC